MSVEVRHVKVSGDISEDKLGEFFDVVKQKKMPGSLYNRLEFLFRQPEDDEDGFTVYNGRHDETASTFYFVGETSFRNNFLSNLEGVDEVRNLVVRDDEVLSIFENEFDNDIEVVNTVYSFNTKQPVLPDDEEEPVKNVFYNWDGNDVLDKIIAGIGQIEDVLVKSSVEDEEKVREDFYNYLDELENRDEWPPGPEYKLSFSSVSVDMDSLEDEFDVYENHEGRNFQEGKEAVYVDFGDDLVVIDETRGVLASESVDSFSQARENVDTLVDKNLVEVKEEASKEVFYNIHKIAEAS